MDILFLHGALASKNQFDQLLPALGDGITAHTLNFSGHGGSMIPLSGFNFTTFSNDILEYVNSKNLKQINLFGYSMGGYAALLFASQHPHLVEKVFTLNVKFEWDLESTFKETSMLNPDKMMEKVPLFANNLMLQHGLNMWKEVLQQTSTMMNNLTNNKMLEEEDLEVWVVVDACSSRTVRTGGTSRSWL